MPTIVIIGGIGVIIMLVMGVAFFWGLKKLETNQLKRKEEEALQKRERKLQGRPDK